MRRIPLSRRSHIIGFRPLPTGVAEHESALEWDFVTKVSWENPEAEITSQPVTISFRDGSIQRRYTPDFMLRCSTMLPELIEVKYQDDLRLNHARLEPSFAAARAWAQKQGATFRVVTEKEIRGPALKNAQRLLPLRNAPIDPQLAACAISAARRLAAPTVGRLVAQLPSDRPAALATLWRLIAQGALRVDLAAPITVDTLVFAA